MYFPDLFCLLSAFLMRSCTPESRNFSVTLTVVSGVLNRAKLIVGAQWIFLEWTNEWMSEWVTSWCTTYWCIAGFMIGNRYSRTPPAPTHCPKPGAKARAGNIARLRGALTLWVRVVFKSLTIMFGRLSGGSFARRWTSGSWIKPGFWKGGQLVLG